MEDKLAQQILAKLDQLTEDFGGMKEEQAKQGSDLKKLSHNVEQLADDMGRLRHIVALMGEDQKTIKNMLKDDKVYHQELVEKHGPRIAALEESMEMAVMDIDFLKKARKTKAAK